MDVDELANTQSRKFLKVNLTLRIAVKQFPETVTTWTYERVVAVFRENIKIKTFPMVPLDTLIALDVTYIGLFKVFFLSTALKQVL